MIKGITDIKHLTESFHQLYDTYKCVYAETDMRAMYNPSRMKVIEAATLKLISKINSECPQCKLPGFSITDAKRGLPCSLCGIPTPSTLSYVHICQHCGYTKEEMYPQHKTTEDPVNCDHCNP
jgi:hypothetical protein